MKGDLPLAVLTGNAHPKLAEEICGHLDTRLCRAEVGRFPDGETRVQVLENVRGRDCFVIQPTCPPVNDHLMELLLLIDALRRASAERVTAVIPYFGYARQDRKHAGRVPITAKLVANLIEAAGASRVLAMDLHSEQIQGFFDIPLDHLLAIPVFVEYLKEQAGNEITVLSPDVGGLREAHRLALRLGVPMAMIDKQRTGPDKTKTGHIVGKVSATHVLVVDDMISTGGSMSEAIRTALAHGAKEVSAVATHPVFSGRVFERIKNTGLRQLVVTNTIPVKKVPDNFPLKVLSVAQLLAQAISNIHRNESVSKLFEVAPP